LVGAANPVQKVTQTEQDYAQYERSDRQQGHRGQLVPDVAVPGEKTEDENHERKAKEDPTNSHKSCNES
jgi:hypothetical protein